MAITTAEVSAMIRDDVWSTMVKQELEEALFAQRMVQWLDSEFPDGDRLIIPTLSNFSVMDYTENTNIAMQTPDAGEFTLEIDKYKQAGFAITDKFKEDSYYIGWLNTIFPQKLVRALIENLENDIFLLHKQQTNNDANTLNGQAHRYAATGSGTVITLADIAQAKLSLDKASVSKAGRVAIVDPTVSYQLVQIDNVIRQDVYGAQSHLKEGFGTTTFIGTYLGFDFYESNMLDEATALDYETGGSLKANIFCGEEAFVGAIRSTPNIEHNRNTSMQRNEYVATMRYGLGLYRPESLVTVLTA